jgi:hypothetical protein
VNYIIAQKQNKKSNSPRGELPLDVIPFQFMAKLKDNINIARIMESVNTKFVDNFYGEE